MTEGVEVGGPDPPLRAIGTFPPTSRTGLISLQRPVQSYVGSFTSLKNAWAHGVTYARIHTDDTRCNSLANCGFRTPPRDAFGFAARTPNFAQKHEEPSVIPHSLTTFLAIEFPKDPLHMLVFCPELAQLSLDPMQAVVSRLVCRARFILVMTQVLDLFAAMLHQRQSQRRRRTLEEVTQLGELIKVLVLPDSSELALNNDAADCPDDGYKFASIFWNVFSAWSKNP